VSGPLRCPCEGRHLETAWRYDAPPEGETRFAFSGEGYAREILRCAACAHYVSRAEMDVSALYAEDYVDATYGDRLRAAFERIVALPPERSDNAGRVERVAAAAGDRRTILDVGSGLCVFLHAMKARGFVGTALDPDPRAAAHAREVVGVEAVHGNYLAVEGLGRFDLVTFNKVLEHVEDPVAMLARAHEHLNPGGLVYVEVPDGEAAAAGGPGREEFFVEHLHVFSAASVAMTAARAGFALRSLERIREPSTKYTLVAFLEAP
jgi:2-polyprenyl-3-methyl-5-hydroxy-6-metoxy-1,4-benzoquinol methylase